MISKKYTLYFVKKYYPNYGKQFCVNILGLPESTIRSLAFRHKIKYNKDSQHFKDFQKRAAVSKVGKKRPEQALVMKRLHAEGKMVWTEERKIKNSEMFKRVFAKQGHPKGMLNKTHSPEVKQKLSAIFKKRWQDPNSKFNSKEFRDELSKRKSKHMAEYIKNKGTIYSRAKASWYQINKDKKYYFRSGWEVVYARFLEHKKNNNLISDWDYEVDTFWFEKIKRGVRSYTPDFKIFNCDGSIEYHEVKGYMDSKSKTKIKRIAKYYPEIKLFVIDKKIYKEIEKNKDLYPEITKIEKNEEEK